MRQLSESVIRTMCKQSSVFSGMVDVVRIRDESTKKYKALLKKDDENGRCHTIQAQDNVDERGVSAA